MLAVTMLLLALSQAPDVSDVAAAASAKTVGKIVARCKVSDEGQLSQCQAVSEDSSLSPSDRQLISIAAGLSRVGPQIVANARAHGGYTTISFKLNEDPNLGPPSPFLAKREWVAAFKIADRTVYLDRPNQNPTVPSQWLALVVTIFDVPRNVNGVQVKAVSDGETFDCAKRSVHLNVRIVWGPDGQSVEQAYVPDYEPAGDDTLAAAKLRQVCSSSAAPLPPTPSSIKELVDAARDGKIDMPKQTLISYEPRPRE